MKKVRQLVPELDDRFRYAVEVRYRTWFQDLAYNFFTDNNICMVWSQLAELRTPPIVTTDFLYLRFRGIDEKNFGKIQKDRVMEMKKWAGKVGRVVKEISCISRKLMKIVQKEFLLHLMTKEIQT